MVESKIELGVNQKIAIIQKSDQVLVTYKDKDILYFDKFIDVGIGEDTYSMRFGEYKFKEKAHVYQYRFKSVSETKRGLDVLFKDKNHKILLSIYEDQGLLNGEFSYTDKRINRLYLNLCTSVDEFPYGCGEQFAAFNLKHKKVKNWVSEHVALSSLIKRALSHQFSYEAKGLRFDKYASYMVQPTFVTNKKRFVHLDCQSYSHFDFRDNVIKVEVREAIGKIYFGVEDNYEGMMGQLTNLLGKQPRLPEWVFDGMILGIQDGSRVCDDKLHKMLTKKAKINGIWAQDWEGQKITKFGKQLHWDWSYDRKLYKALPDYIKKWQAMNVRFLGYINPFLALDGDLYKEASKNGYCVKNKKGQDYLVTITTFPAAMIDLTHPDAFAFMKKVIKDNMIGIGLKGWMADFAEYLPTDAVLYNGQDPRLVHNTWPVRWAKCQEEAIAESGLTDEIFYFVRAGYTGSGHHAKIMWNGDQHVDWSRDYGIGSIVNSQLSLGLSGIGNSHSDIGGYTTFGRMIRSKELLLRWTEMNAFSMIMRSHEGNQPQKNHQFDSDEETMNHVAKFSRIYEGLKAYHLAVDIENHESGMPSVRPLFFYYDNPSFYYEDQAYLLGRDLLVYPIVTKGQDTMEIDLPVDDWIHVFTGQEYKGGYTKLDCPLGKPAVFYRRDSEFSYLFEQIKYK